MLRNIIMGAAALSLLSFVDACSCGPDFPGPLSTCSVDDDFAALLVSMKCVKSIVCDINTGAAVVDVVIDKVFKDKSGLGLSDGDMVTVRSPTQESICGVGLSFKPNTQWILFATAVPQGSSGGNIPGVFSDGTVCDVGGADLHTFLCAGPGNRSDPTQAEIDELMESCDKSPGPPIVGPPIVGPPAVS